MQINLKVYEVQISAIDEIKELMKKLVMNESVLSSLHKVQVPAVTVLTPQGHNQLIEALSCQLKVNNPGQNKEKTLLPENKYDTLAFVKEVSCVYRTGCFILHTFTNNRNPLLLIEQSSKQTQTIIIVHTLFRR